MTIFYNSPLSAVVPSQPSESSGAPTSIWPIAHTTTHAEDSGRESVETDSTTAVECEGPEDTAHELIMYMDVHSLMAAIQLVMKSPQVTFLRL